MAADKMSAIISATDGVHDVYIRQLKAGKSGKMATEIPFTKMYFV